MKNNRTMLWITAALPLLLAAISYHRLPETIAIHWGMSGAPNGFAPRLAVIPLGMIGLLLTALLLWAGQRQQRQGNRRFLEGLIVLLNLLITAVMAMTISEALHPGQLDIGCLTTVLVGLLFLWLGNYLPKVKPNAMIGVRNGWTLSDERVWKKTQRGSGWMMVFGGLLMVLSAFVLPPMLRIIAVLVIAAVCAVGSTIASAVWYRQENPTK